MTDCIKDIELVISIGHTNITTQFEWSWVPFKLWSWQFVAIWANIFAHGINIEYICSFQNVNSEVRYVNSSWNLG